MIYESSYWKNDLIYLSKKINNEYIKLKIDCEEKYLVDFEKDIMIAAYSIRKLIEAGKISDDIANIKVNVNIYKAKRKVNKMNWLDLDKNYESRYRKSTKYLRTICNIIIHSYCFMSGFDNKRKFKYLYFNSADQKDIEIYSIKLEEFALVLEKVGSDYPNQCRYVYNEEKSDYEYSCKTIYPEPWNFYKYLKQYSVNDELVINEISTEFNIPIYKIKELLKTLRDMRDEDRYIKTLTDLSKELLSGVIDINDISREYDIPKEFIKDFIKNNDMN